MSIPLKTRRLNSGFGVEVEGINLCDVTADHLYPEIRTLFETESLLLFRNQNLDDKHHIQLAELFGPLEDREADEKANGEPFEIFQVSNKTEDGSLSAEEDPQTLDLIANQLWHTDSTFLPIPALMNILRADVVPSQGGETEIASTRLAFEQMPEALKRRIEGKVIWHKVSHSRTHISEEFSKRPEFTKWPPQKWNSIWQNPVTGKNAIYIASHAYRIESMEDDAAQVLIEEVISFCTQPQFVYRHQWQVGDVLIWDERSTLHRGQPWPYEEERSLSSICSSVMETDGLASVRPKLKLE